jgi:uncharacterized protein (DUF58 family)
VFVTLIFRAIYCVHRWTLWLQHRILRRFTRAGLVVLTVMTVAGLMAPDTDNNLAYQGFALGFFMLSVSILFSWSFRGKFSVERHLPRFGTVGQPLTYSVTVRNRARTPQLGLSLLESLVDPRPAFPDWLAVKRAEERELRSFRFANRRRRQNRYKLAEIKEAFLPTLPPGQEMQTKVELKPLRRGILKFTGVMLTRTDPFGLCRAFRKVQLPQTTVILPRRYALPPTAFPGTMKYQEGGVAMASHVGQSEEFVSLRDYRYGDPLRHIHWRSWARTGKPVVKEFEDEFFVRHALVLDTFTDRPHSEAFEEAVSVAASFACTLDTQDSLLDLLFVGAKAFCFTAGRGLAHADQMLEILASVKTCDGRPFEHLENLVIEHAASVSGCICVLLAWDEPRQELVRKLEALGLPVMVLVITEPDGKIELNGEPRPGKFFVLEAGKIERGLANLK